MSQDIFNDIDPTITSGEDLADLLNLFKDGVASGMIGPTRPTNLQAGGMWIDNSLGGSPDFLWKLKIWDGTNEISLLTVNISTNALIFTDTNDIFQITKISADTAGAIIALVKNRIANNGQVLAGDVIGEYQWKVKNDDGDTIIPVRMKAVAINNYTDASQGTYIAWEATTTGTALLIEMMRLYDGNLGIGDTAPERRVTVKGSTDAVGFRADRASDDASGVKNKHIKRRVTGVGQVQSGDSIELTEYYSVDEAGALQQIAKDEVVASENQTTTSRKVERKISTIGADGVTMTETINISALGTWLKKGAKFDAIELVSQDIATAASITGMSAANSFVRFTGVTATALHGIAATGFAKLLHLINVSTAIVTIKHQSTTDATAANRFLCPNGADVNIPANGSVTVAYDATAARWKVIASAGTARFIRNADQSIAAAGIVAISADMFESIFLQGNGAARTADPTTPLANGLYEGQIKKVIGKDATNTLTLLHGGNLHLNGDITLGLNDSVELYWDHTGTKWIEQSRNKY